MARRAADIARASGRDFLQSHPWLSFSLDLRSADRHLWQLLGEARSKCRHLLLTPLKPAVAHELERIYLAKGMQATTAIEGNTLTLEQVREAIEGRLKVRHSQEYLKQEVDNVLAACEIVAETVRESGEFRLTPQLLKRLNETVLEGVELDDHVQPGAYRDVSVVAGPYRAAPAADVNFLVDLLCDWLNEDFDASGRSSAFDPFLFSFAKAIVAHVYIAWIHPFGDGNGRTARLVELGILTSTGIPSVAAHLLSNHYNLTRSAYYRQLDRASASGGDLCPFLSYAAEGFVDLLQEQLDRVHEEVLVIAWENYVHETFASHASDAGRRQRELVIALGRRRGPVPRGELRRLTPELSAAYASKQDKTLTRDMNKVLDTGLVERTPTGLRAKREVMLGFMPKADGGALSNVLID